MSWISVEDHLPEVNQYVLVHVTKDNWGDDPNVYYKIVRFIRGLSMAERLKMKLGELPDPDSLGWIAPNDNWKLIKSKRSSTYEAGDEHGNNLRPYCWEEHGPGQYFGQEVDYWMPIPVAP